MLVNPARLPEVFIKFLLGFWAIVLRLKHSPWEYWLTDSPGAMEIQKLKTMKNINNLKNLTYTIFRGIFRTSSKILKDGLAASFFSFLWLVTKSKLNQFFTFFIVLQNTLLFINLKKSFSQSFEAIVPSRVLSQNIVLTLDVVSRVVYD